MHHSAHVLTCFHTKASFQRCVLGVGVRLLHEGPKVRCEVVFEPLSNAAFSAGVRYGVFRNIFNHFLPLAEGSVEKDQRARAEQCITLAEYEAQKAAKKA